MPASRSTGRGARGTDELKQGDAESLGINVRALVVDGNGAFGVWGDIGEGGRPRGSSRNRAGDALVRRRGHARAGRHPRGVLRGHPHAWPGCCDRRRGLPTRRQRHLRGPFNGDELALVDGDADPVDPVGTFVTVENDTGNLSVDVPDSWVQVAGAPFTDSAGVTWDALTVSPDLQDFAIDYLVAGVALQSSPALVGTDKDAALTSSSPPTPVRAAPPTRRAITTTVSTSGDMRSSPSALPRRRATRWWWPTTSTTRTSWS